MHTATCSISHKMVPESMIRKGENLPESIFMLIQSDYPDFGKDSLISIEALIPYRKRQLSELLKQESGEVHDLEKEVVEAIAGNQILSENIGESNDDRTTGQRLADRIAEFGGSWAFIGIFFFFLFTWMGINIWMTAQYGKEKAFDSYPFILLNLILSCLAAIQAPIIMMSQNRKEQKDRVRNEHDYQVNLKAELEIKLLHEKIDHLMVNQNKRLLEIQQLQTDYLEDILRQIKSPEGK